MQRTIQPHQSHAQRTLVRPIAFDGTGLHTGEVSRVIVRPAQPNSGLLFRSMRAGTENSLIEARWYNVVDTDLSTVLANPAGASVATVEHLLSALRGCGVDNALIDVDGPEIPILDGSALPFVQSIRRAGVVAQAVSRWAIRVATPISVRRGDSEAILLPDREPRITIDIDFSADIIGKQRISLSLDECSYAHVAPARTFGFAEQLDELRARGKIRGGDLDNAVVIRDGRVMNTEGLRFADEFVRHKALDCVGDLTLAGYRIMGHLYAYKPGHGLVQALLRKLFAQHRGWSFGPLTGVRPPAGYAQDPSRLNAWLRRLRGFRSEASDSRG